MHRCSREKKKDSKHARVSVQVLALALGTLYSVLYVLYILSSYAHRASLLLRRRRLLVAGESGMRRAAVRRCDMRCGRRAVAVYGGGGAAGAAAMGRLFTLTRHHTYIAQHTLCLSHPQLDCKIGLLCK
jgi:hypothetical protein